MTSTQEISGKANRPNWKSRVKYMLYCLATIASVLVLVNAWSNVSFMARFPMSEKVEGRMAHQFAARAWDDWLESMVAAPVAVLCIGRLWSEFARRRTALRSASRT